MTKYAEVDVNGTDVMFSTLVDWIAGRDDTPPDRTSADASTQRSDAEAVATLRSDGGTAANTTPQAGPELDQDEQYYQETEAPAGLTPEAAEASVRANLEQVLDASGTAMRIIGPEFNVIMQNDMMAELSGVDDDMLDTVPCYGAMCNDDVCGTDNCTLKQLMAGERERIEVEVEKETYEGETVPTKLVATAIEDDDGEVVAISESFIDLSEMKAATEQFNAVVDDVSDGDLETAVDTTDLDWYYEEMGESLNAMIAIVVTSRTSRESAA